MAKGMFGGQSMKKKIYSISFHCYYPLGEPTRHYQQMKLCKIPKWIKAYKLTHPGCKAVSVKVWYADT
jgi:hypothetical protein